MSATGPRPDNLGAGAHRAPSRRLWAPRTLPALEPDAAEDLERYRAWVWRREEERSTGGAEDSRVAPAPPAAPDLDLVMVVARPDPAWFRRSLAAIAAQTTTGWSLRVGVIGELDSEAEQILAAAMTGLAKDRGSAHRLATGTGVAQATAAVVRLCTADAFMLVGQDDQLAPDAVALMAQAVADAPLAYADEDAVDDDGLAFDPVLKPAWSPELYLSFPYAGSALAVRRGALEDAGGIEDIAAGDWVHHMVLRVSEATDRIAHVPEVLWHRRRRAHETAGDGAVTRALERRAVDATVERGPLAGSWTVRRRPPAGTVSIIVPFRDQPRFVRSAVDSLFATLEPGTVQLILVDNDSEEPETESLLERLGALDAVVVRRDARPFNWAAVNNAATDVATGDVLVFLNNDVEARRGGWIEPLVAHARREEVGAVGARLVYPNGRLQHAGVVLGLAGAAGHVLAGLAGDKPGYLGMAVLPRECSAVTGACLATSRKAFDRLDGFDETLGFDLNDVDYCLRARRDGLHVVYEPQAELVHHESPSRGTSGNPRDSLYFLDRWLGDVLGGDPFLNPHLTRLDGSVALRHGDEEAWWAWWQSNLSRG